MRLRSSKLGWLGLMLPLLFLPSCAIVASGTFQSVSIESTPSGAQVEVDLIPRGTTPLEIPLRRGKPHQVTLYKEGFKAERVVTGSRFNPLTLFTIWLPPAAMLDEVSGSMFSIRPNLVHVSLQELGEGERKEGGRLDGAPPTPPVGSPAPLAVHGAELD